MKIWVWIKNKLINNMYGIYRELVEVCSQQYDRIIPQCELGTVRKLVSLIYSLRTHPRLKSSSYPTEDRGFVNGEDSPRLGWINESLEVQTSSYR